MLYLVKPTGEMVWNDLPAEMVLEAAAEHGADLSQLGWQPAERRADETTVALALRYGTKCPTGIVLDGAYVVKQHRPALLTQTHEQAARSNQAAFETGKALMERAIPGWTDNSRALDDRVNESHRRQVEAAQADVDQALARQDVNPDLVEHWLRLGGRIPARG